eukprot:2942322-Amphidinium_carterae.1
MKPPKLPWCKTHTVAYTIKRQLKHPIEKESATAHRETSIQWVPDCSHMRIRGIDQLLLNSTRTDRESVTELAVSKGWL